jgi:hypothetical protein
VFHSGIRPGGGGLAPGRSVGPPTKFDQKIFFGALQETPTADRPAVGEKN